MFKSFGRSSSWIRRSTSSTNQQSSTTAAISTPAVSASIGSGGAAIASTSPNLRHSIVGGTALTLRNLQLQPQPISTQLLHRTMSSEAATSSAQHKHTNRLAQEKSPYLLQHAHNPVDWYPWGDEAIELARKQNKLIFLSVGYSTCHWCHVMEHESFENEAVAKIMNENFINIKVDREERPDIDKIYMQFVLMMNGSGGWPMSVWLTPDLAPITAGTYFPPHDRWGMPSFTTVLKAIAEKWSTNQEELKSTGLQVIKAIQKTLTEKTSDATFEPGSADAKLKEALKILKQRYDEEFGGFGSHPKFPEVARINFLFHAYIVTKDMDVLDMALQTLQKIGNGGIHDHIFGGFARYSVDREWHVPHFEKMLYDQGQLMAAYANAYKMTKDGAFLKFAEGIFNYIMKDLHHPDGGFYSGEDADSLPTANDTKKVEGAFYAWTAEEIRGEIAETEPLYDEGFDKDRVFEIYKYHYDVRTTGNVLATSDPHGHLNGKNVLIVRDSEENTCAKFNITTAQLESILRVTNEALLKRRNQRPRPHLDTKIISSWNGLVLSGLSKLANCNSERRDEYMNAGRQLVNFIKENLYDAEKQILLRSCYGVGTDSSELESVTSERIEGFLDDYSFVIKGLCDYYKASLDGSILQWAKELQDIQDKLFWDSTHGAYYFSQENSPNVVARLKSDHDGAEPCGNSVAARNLILLAHYFDDDNYRQRAGKLLNFFADEQPFGYALPEMMCALMLHENGLDLVAVVGPDTEATKRFVEICRKFYIPGMIIVHVDPQQPTTAYSQRVQEKFKMINNKPTVYICHDKVCRMPVTDPVELEENLTENFFQKERI